MELKLYNFLEEQIFQESGFDPQKNKYNLEEYNPDLPLNYETLEDIKHYVDRYNILNNSSIKLRYYQILALYFTEFFFENRKELNLDNNMLAYWMATGSGKTIIMHINILQYLNTITGFDKLQIILTTPGINLIEQHRREVIPLVRELNKKYNNKIELLIDTTAALLQKDENYFDLPDNDRIKRLILVDEGHIGLSSNEEGEYRRLRRRLNVKNSFLFEYSATYDNLVSSVQEEYENLIVYDYAYKHFFQDGYGKDFYFKTISENVDESEFDNLKETFKVFNEKLDVFQKVTHLDYPEKKEHFPVNLPDKPLLAFMGNTVAKPDDEGDNDEVSDIGRVVNYLADMHGNAKRTIAKVFNNQYQGSLRLTRNKNVNDEILLSFGDNDYWGIINVGSGDRFFNEIENPRIEKRTVSLLDDKYLFKNLDSPKSPINVLVGSRKFAEGWNSFRLSVIGLINLGSSKGNKIIQIFGRGVRLKGANGDGRRKNTEHNENYYDIDKSNIDGKVRSLETLTIFSLKKSYLEQFVREVQKETTFTSFQIQVEPTVIELGKHSKLEFEDYKEKLKIFKSKKKFTGIKKVILNGSKVEYSYLDDNDNENSEVIRSVKFPLDFRTDKSVEQSNIIENLKEHFNKYEDFLDTVTLNYNFNHFAEKNDLQIYKRNNGAVKSADFHSMLNLVDELYYKELDTENVNIQLVENLTNKVIEEVTKKLKNKINHHINSKNYVYDETIKKSTAETKGDILYKYTITKKFDNEAQKKQFLDNFEARKNEILSEIDLIQKYNNIAKRHIFDPLYKEFNELNISPDVLNPGELKFLLDITEYIDHNYSENNRYEFYLMRNNVGSIGIYLETDEAPFYPDFILWIIDNGTEETKIIFFDPKGERGIWSKSEIGANEKVKIGLKNDDNNTLPNLENKLSAVYKKPFSIHSFILLRDSSDLGKKLNPDDKDDLKTIKEQFISKNVLRLDWHTYREGEDRQSYSNKFIENKSYLDIIFEKVLK